jgi:chaperonin GroES
VRQPSGALTGVSRPDRKAAEGCRSPRPKGAEDEKIFPPLGRRELIQQPNKKQNQTMALNVKPLGDRILVEAVEEKEVKKGGIIIPDTAKEKPMESIVIALGTGKTNDEGKKVPFEVKKGDRVLVSKYGGTEIKLDGREYKILNCDDVLAVLE